jgi:2-polyprenyl-3-methyl-5-hydroxy-6-metoxy-1,4-benzoquinol methylase
MAASLGFDALGFDVSERAIELARRKAKERSVAARFLVADARALTDLDGPFDTVLDCGLFHVLGDDDQKRYVSGLTEMIPSGPSSHALF